MTSFSFDSNRIGSSPRLIVGLGIVLFGVLLMLDQLGMADARAVLRFWPLILVAIGLQQFFNPRERRSGRTVPMNGIIWMAIGGILLLNSFGVLRVSVGQLFWPIVLIALGVRLMTRPARGKADGAAAPGMNTAPSSDIGAVFAVLGGVKRVSAPQPFHGAEVTTFMGGAHLDLRQALLSPGAEAVLDIFAVMGGCELLIPPQWVVSAPIVAVMGGVDDKRLPLQSTLIHDTTASPAGPPRLVIRGLVMMGSVTIRS